MARPKVPGYVIDSKIGSGTYADVFKAHKPESNREYVAIKCILKGKLSTSSVESICTEIKLLKLLKHPHIVQMYDFCWDESYIYIVMEFCDGGDLSSFIKTRQHLNERVCQSFLQQLASALEFLRANSVSHMDLKPQNLLLTSKSNPQLKLTDFGLAQLLGNQQRETSLRGSPLYMAPEILLQQSYDASVDLWSTGVILYECLFGKAPYSSQTLGDLIEKIKNNTAINIPVTTKISNDCRNLLTKLLQRNPKQRITFDEFFRHPFVNLAAYRRSTSDPGSSLPRNSTSAPHRSLPVPANSGQSPGTNRRTGITSFEELRSLANATPSLKTALEIGREGVQYDAEGAYSTAFDRYEAALQSIIPILNKEPKGRRKDLLHQQATLWMDRAENLQQRIKQQESLCAEELYPEDLGQCCLQ